MIRALICDDEALVRSELAYTLKRVDPQIELVETGNAIDALAELQQERFDVIFLDVRMPGLSGLDAMKVIRKSKHPPHVVFVTAHEEHAVAAFEYAALDYVLKPVAPTRIALTLERLHAVLAERGDRQRATPAPSRLPVEAQGRTRLVPLGDVRAVRADDRNVRVVLFDETVRFRGSLTECAERLGRRFLRVHRAFIVNLDHVLDVCPSFGGTYVVHVDDRARTEVPVSRSYARDLREALGI